MDIVYFLKQRTKLIKFYYDNSVEPFREIQRKIDLGLQPFDMPEYDESGEPPYLDEWMDAETAVQLSGVACISMLSDTLKLYFRSLERRVIGFVVSSDFKAFAKKNGFVEAYKGCLGEILKTDWSDCPVQFNVIEQVVHARNRGQHGDDITSVDIAHDLNMLAKHPQPFFASELETKVWNEHGGGGSSIFAPKIEITRENLFAAIAEIEQLADWIEGRMDQAWQWRASAMSKVGTATDEPTS